jgi:hypothetical protein
MGDEKRLSHHHRRNYREILFGAARRRPELDKQNRALPAMPRRRSAIDIIAPSASAIIGDI